MEFKVIYYPDRVPKEIIDIPTLYGSLKVNDVFFYNDKQYKVLDIKHKAILAKFNADGQRIWPSSEEVFDPLKDSIFPEIIITEVPAL